MKRGFITGTVSHATLAPQDLIPVFLSVLAEISPEETFEEIPVAAQENYSHKWWDSDDCYFLLEALFHSLDEQAPEGHYFGAHPGDGSDFGFWPVELLDG